MTRTFVTSLKRPHETLDIPMPFGRKIAEAGKGWWIPCLWMATILCLGVYLYQISRSASKGFVMRDLEKQTEVLNNDVDALQRQYASLQSLDALQSRLKGLGYVPVDQVEYVGSMNTTYALAK